MMALFLMLWSKWILFSGIVFLFFFVLRYCDFITAQSLFTHDSQMYLIDLYKYEKDAIRFCINENDQKDYVWWRQKLEESQSA